jgi:ABC-type xylose transport system permease subunit
MKHEHTMCRANNIKQKRLLGGNLAQKEKKNQIFFLFPFYFIFVILLYSFSFISTLRTMLCLKYRGIERILIFFVVSRILVFFVVSKKRKV